MNHEAWAIPYGDLITLLLAFFVVMYAVSSVNEGKYRVMAEALAEAFGGPPRSLEPIQVGNIQKAQDNQTKITKQSKQVMSGMGGGMRALNQVAIPGQENNARNTSKNRSKLQLEGKAAAQLQVIRDEINEALVELIEKDLVVVRRTAFTLAIEIKTDILFPSGQAALTTKAKPVIHQLGEILKPYENPIRVEGHTDNIPISTRVFPSNWELSSTRASSVVHEFVKLDIDPKRMSVQGYGEFQPVGDNRTLVGRNMNRRVVIVVMPAAEVGDVIKDLAEIDDQNIIYESDIPLKPVSDTP